MIHADELRNNPVQYTYDQSRVLKIRVNSISKMRSVPIIANIVDKSKRARDMQSNRIRLHSDREILKSVHRAFAIELIPKRSECAECNLLEQAQRCFTEPTTFYFRKAEPAEVETPLCFSVSVEHLGNETSIQPRRQSGFNNHPFDRHLY